MNRMGSICQNFRFPLPKGDICKSHGIDRPYISHHRVLRFFLIQLSDCSALLEKIAEHIYSTRNEIAHAKANYEKRGTECPAREKASFCKMLEIIAIRCIRWFAIQPEEKRVVPHEK